MDRRVKKSRKAIESALIKLMSEKDIEEITIDSIANLADVSRGTVYLNYQDKYDILEKCIDSEINKLVQSCIPPDVDDQKNLNEQTLLLRTFMYIESHSSIFITLFKSKGVQSFHNKLLTIIRDQMLSQVSLTGINKDVNREIFTQFWAGAIIGLIEWWVKNSFPYSSEEITQHLFNLLSRNEVIPG